MNFRSIPKLELFKLLIYVLYQFLMTLMFLCLIPTYVLIRGYILSKKNHDLEYLISAIKKSRLYTVLTLAMMQILLFADTYLSPRYSTLSRSELWFEVGLFFLISVIFGGIYFILSKFFALLPLERFSNLILTSYSKDKYPNVIQRDNFVSYSVADELLKWNDLKNKGLISDEEFIKIKQKIMNSD